MPRAVRLLLVVLCGVVTVAGAPAASAGAASSHAIHVRVAATVMTKAGAKVRLAVRGVSGRTVVAIHFRRAGTHKLHRKRRVLRHIHGKRTVTFHLYKLERGALYGYKALVSSGSHQATVYGTFMFAAVATPTATTGAVDLAGTRATLHGTVAANGTATQAWFDFGEGSSLNHQTPIRSFAASSSSASISDSLSGLVVGHTYSYRVSARNTGGTVRGAIRTFIAAAAPTPPVTTPPTTPPVVTPPVTTPPTTPPSSAPPATVPPPTGTKPPTPAPLPTPSGAVYYVSTSGSDSADGSAARPWRTLAKAAASTPAGATAIIASGTYAGFTMSRSGSSGSPITFQAASVGSVHVTPPAGASVITIAGAHYITLTGLSIEGAGGSQNAGVDVLDGSSYITVSGGTLANNRSYGVDVNGSTYVSIVGNTITGNDVGIRINRAGAGVVIDSNDVVNNTGMVVNDPAPSTDWGAVGISFLHTVGPIVAKNNTIHGNRAPSDDYGYDGGAFEIYGSSGATMASNRIWDNQDVIETGTDGQACANNTFARNVAWGGNNKSVVSLRGPQVNGIILRCGQNMLIANNTFDDLDYWVYDISASGGFAGNIAGFKIENNVSYQAAHKIYAIEVALPGDAVIDNNVSYNSPGAPFASVPGNGNVPNIATFRSLEGREQHGLYGNPLFTNLGGLDFHLLAGSPAIDAGTPIAGVTDGYHGAAPDAGAYER